MLDVCGREQPGARSIGNEIRIVKSDSLPDTSPTPAHTAQVQNTDGALRSGETPDGGRSRIATRERRGLESPGCRSVIELSIPEQGYPETWNISI